MTDSKYAAFTALDPFFEISQQGLRGLVDGDHTILIPSPMMQCSSFDMFSQAGPQTSNGRQALMALYAGYGNNIVLHRADALVIHRSEDCLVS